MTGRTRNEKDKQTRYIRASHRGSRHIRLRRIRAALYRRRALMGLGFSSANSGSSGLISDRNGVVLARFGGGTNLYADDEQTRLSCYHALGDYTGATATGVINNFWDNMQGFSLVTGTTKAQSFAMSLNIDSRLNNSAYEALAGRNGAVLVMNYKNGELLCMVSSPSIDPLADNSNPPDGAYINRCLSASFTPGSVFKLITARPPSRTFPISSPARITARAAIR